ncbi:UNVERIFIED_CONTAM: Arginine decarboxylase [Sesamum latifolium]|uniref:Arginine decarboxylase n=1 Tax=Sesamum latifolium TaxID=2727402 RepID=A0AAW2XLV2_9LAMI
MPALACCVDAAVSSQPYAFSGWDSVLPDSPPSLNTSSVAPASAVPAVWSPAHSALLYRVDGWGAPYFTVNSNGNVSVRPYGFDTLAHQEIDLLKIVKKASDPKTLGGLGLQLPLIVRFPDVLKHRLESLQSAFDFAIESQGYEAHYQGVYPVKCNQNKFVVEDIVKFGSGFRFGLEAGSKPELLLAMSCLCNGSPEALLVCNGFKDAEYISLALVARKLHLNTVIVLEQEEELDTVIEISKKLDVRPIIGARAKLRTKHSGHFGSTSVAAFPYWISNSSTSLLADGVGEAAQIYCELVRLGACMKVIDIGGGLGIDYDGSKSEDSDCSVGYSLQDYASAVVQAVRLVCDRKGVKHPVIYIFSWAPVFLERLTDDALSDYQNLSAAAIHNEYDTCLLYAEQLKQRCVEQFKEGSLGMEQLAAVDALCELVSNAIGVSDSVRTYHVNLSVFTSIPDFWGISQLFPIIPIHRLDERPAVRGILSDLTCDSDGKIDKFVGGGAYEEAIGGVHNLFGGPSVVQHEPELMFETLKHRVEEFSSSDGGSSSMALINGLACSFNNMPYLAAASSCSLTAAGINGYYCCDDEDYAAAADTVTAEDEQWSYCVA